MLGIKGADSAHAKPSPVRWQSKASGPALFNVDPPNVKAATEAIARQTVKLNGTSFSIEASATGYATVTLVALDGKGVAISNRLLLSVGGLMDTMWHEIVPR